MTPNISPPTLDLSPFLTAYRRQVDLLMALERDDLAAVDPPALAPIWVPVTTVSKVVDQLQ